MSYGKIVDDEVVEIKDNIPNDNSHSNIQGDMNFANSLGWYELIEERPTLHDYQSITEVSHELQGDNKIHGVFTVVDESLESYKIRRIAMMKQDYKTLILAQYDEEDQRNAALGLETQTIIDTLKAFISDKRNEYKGFKTQINNASTLDEVEMITWL